MLTFDLWHATGKDFTEIARPGEEVDDLIIGYFINVLPPRSLQSGYMQVGEPYSHREDKTGNWKATYLTFKKNIYAQWIYCGPCFKGETECQC